MPERWILGSSQPAWKSTNHNDHLWNREERSLVEYRNVMVHQLFHEEKSGELIFILIFGDSSGNYVAQNYDFLLADYFFRKLETNMLFEVNVARHTLICKTYCCKIYAFFFVILTEPNSRKRKKGSKFAGEFLKTLQHYKRYQHFLWPSLIPLECFRSNKQCNK